MNQHHKETMTMPGEGITAEKLQRLSAPVPRYTSYPTANHFSESVQHATYREWLQALEPGSRLSLYLHVPYCHELCWYCACNTKAVRRYAPVAAYLESLDAEMANLARVLPRHVVKHIHWGGGSPNVLETEDIRRFGDALASRFNISASAEHAVEIDPRLLSDAQVAAFAAMGVNRVSMGVQDFEPAVQAAIGRQQSYAVTARAIDAFRAVGVPSINIDLVYGLPHQTLESAMRTMQQVLTLSPDRIAIFGYAHIPQRMKNQRLIDAASLPGLRARLEMSTELARGLEVAGYVQIGIDHFAKPNDALATASVQRNFQGYTTDEADALLGMGASAIGRLPQGFVQNAVPAEDYARRIRDYGFATARGIALTADDRIRAATIERLMCDFTFSERDLAAQFGVAARPLIAEARAVLAEDHDRLLDATPDGFRVAPHARPFVRTVCAKFDAYLGASKAVHSVAV